ncbi:MAG: hypothetical protein E3K37_17650 [Candidatus Kuenenia sp.]|nr:hypothetical protein [Candidatus Kuenenia hertensis]
MTTQILIRTILLSNGIFVLKIHISFAPVIEGIKNVQVQFIPEVTDEIKDKYLSQSIEKS